VIRSLRDASSLLRIDALFELVTGLLLWFIAFTSLTGWFLWPPIVGASLLLLAGALLMLLAPVLWWLSKRTTPGLVRSVAVGNGSSALGVAAWLVLQSDGFNAASATFVALVSLALATLALLQSRAARGPTAV
jgi:hypothetical protein